MDAVFDFVNEEEAVLGVDKCQSDSEEAIDAVTQATQWNWLIEVPDLDECGKVLRASNSTRRTKTKHRS